MQKTYHERSTCAETDDKLNECGEGEESNDERGGKDDASIKEAEMRSRPISESVNDNGEYVGEFDASTFLGDNFMIFLRMRKK